MRCYVQGWQASIRAAGRQRQSNYRAEDNIHLPEYAGSLLRGQFGAALRRTACMTGLKHCPHCPLFRTCPSPAIFETPAPAQHALQKFSHVPNPYVIEPPPFGTRAIAAGESLSFHVVLVGRALGQLPLILRWLDWTRYSSRQRQEMTLGGVVGIWRLQGDLGPLLPWLWLGQWLHVGKSAVMGMGGYRLEVHATSSAGGI